MIGATAAVILLAMIPASGSAQSSPATGTISGTVTDEAERPVPRARLVYMKLTEYARDERGRQIIKEPGFTKSATAGAEGSFVLSGLLAGTYDVCAYGTQPSQVGSCDWGGIPVISLAAGQTVTNLRRTVRNGTVVMLHVADPNARIGVADSKGRVARERRFFIGLSSESGFYRRAQAISRTPTAHVFRITIPRQMPARLFIDTDLSVTDVSGSPLETGRPTLWQMVPAGRETVTVNLNVR